ncbi:aminoglycoside adenylyltransferase domain-containing protein [Streptomyces sp. NPDC001816]|uniref:nucleotidyltransferase domain-containing protein n=1 Tax=Streptomyces sp. NPDC001816 TaxID=3364612 RepID=UPI00369218AB
MTPRSLPQEVRQSVDRYLQLTDEAVPGLVQGLYLHGSLTFGDFRPGRSDIDFLAVLSERPSQKAVDVLGEVFVELSSRHPRPYFDGLHVTHADLAGSPKGCPDVPCVQEWDFRPAGHFGRNPVTWHELAQRAVTVRGPQLTADDVWTDQSALRAYSHANLDEFWRSSLDELRAGPGQEWVFDGPAERGEWVTEWFVLGIARLHHLLATDRLTSKTGAGRHALTAFDGRWQPIVHEALRIREGSTTSAYEGDPIARLQDTIAFAAMAIEEGRRLGP